MIIGITLLISSVIGAWLASRVWPDQTGALYGLRNAEFADSDECRGKCRRIDGARQGAHTVCWIMAIIGMGMMMASR